MAMSSAPPAILIRPPSYHGGSSYGDEQPQFIIISPMHIVNLRKKKRSFAVRCAQKFRLISEKWFSHILLLAIMLCYAMLGAIFFHLIENPHETREKTSIIRMRERIVNELGRVPSLGIHRLHWMNLTFHRMKEYEAQVLESFSQGITSDSEKTQWTFWGSLFFCGTVFTTIGYGNIAPTTTTGRAVFMIYAIIGIPLLLMVLADLGKLFTRGIKNIFFQVRRFYYTGKCQKARRMGRRATAVPVEYMAIAWKSVPNPRGKRGSHDINPSSEKESKHENGIQETAEAITTVPVESETTKLNIDIDDEFNLPVSVAMILLVAYMMLGALIFTLWEDWTFFEAFYFVFVSMSTIGFGDFVPDHPMFMMASFIYLLFGLALTSMCINVVQEKLSEIFEVAKMRIGTTVGFDLRNGQMEGFGELQDGQGSKASTRRGSARSSPTNETDIDVPYSKESTKSPSPYKDTPPRMSPNYNAIQRESTSSPVSESGKT